MSPRFSTQIVTSIGLSLGALVVAIGCTNKAQDDISRITARQTIVQERRDAVREAFRYLPQLIRLDRTTALKEIRYQLMTWASSVKPSDDWKSPAVLESVSPSLRSTDFSKRMKSLDFGESECEYLLQCQMLSEVAKWVLELPYRDALLREWMEQKKKELSAEESLRLESTLKLFDWSIMNVGLVGNPKEVEELSTNPDLPLSDNGVIYRQLPWQTMMFAQGNRWQRCRLFTQLLFTQGIDSVVLALPSKTGAVENASIRPWCVAVPIGDELYLFEPTWGFPIPSQKDSGIASLREAKADPNVLRRAKLPGQFEYPVEQKDLETLVALVDCDPFAVGLAMHTLQKSLTGGNRIRITMDADQFEERLLKIDNKLSVRLWNVPWLSYLYNESIRDRLTEQSPFSIQYMEQFGSYIMETPLSRARSLHFKGKFQSTIEETGALSSYMSVRVDEQTLKELVDDKELQQEFGIVRGAFETREMFDVRLQLAQKYFRRSKFDVNMFLALCNIDNNKPETAIDWLQKRILGASGSEKWHSHSHYLLGRMYEQTGQWQSAAEQYKYEDSAQSAGNRIRLRKLRQLHPEELGSN
jgi:hypothetical protein